MSIRISFPIKNRHRASVGHLENMLKSWVEEQHIIQTESASIWMSDPPMVDIIPWFLNQDDKHEVAIELSASFQQFLDKELAKTPARNKHQDVADALDQQFEPIPPQDNKVPQTAAPWYQVDERFSIDYV